MSTEYLQEQQIKRLQKFGNMVAVKLAIRTGENVIASAIEDGVIREDDLYNTP